MENNNTLNKTSHQDVLEWKKMTIGAKVAIVLWFLSLCIVGYKLFSLLGD